MICTRCHKETPEVRHVKFEALWNFADNLGFNPVSGSNYQVDVCLDCRGDFVTAVEMWFKREHQIIVRPECEAKPCVCR